MNRRQRVGEWDQTRRSGILLFMGYRSSTGWNRIYSAAGAVVVQAALLFALANGFHTQLVKEGQRHLQLFDLTDQTPPPPPLAKPQPPAAREKPQGEAAPPNRTSTATPVVAPTPVVVLPPVSPVITAPVANEGAERSSGSAEVDGPGTGAGGVGDGLGSGGAGDGRGGGEGTPLRLRSGRITDRDYPREALRAGAQGIVHLEFVVGVNGRVTSCRVTQTSGNQDLDQTTCRLIQQRFRYSPSRDARGRPYPDTVTGQHRWELWERPGAQEDSTED